MKSYTCIQTGPRAAFARAVLRAELVTSDVEGPEGCLPLAGDLQSCISALRG